MPSFCYERKFQRRGFKIIAGVDEVGRGPLAGPVLACALVLHKSCFKERIDDSKKLSDLQRERAYREIVKSSVFGLGKVGEKEIDEQNIQQASLGAMKIAIVNLVSSLHPRGVLPHPGGVEGAASICFLIDGIFNPEVDYCCESIVGGDAKSLSIACASIVAKVTRDNIMRDYHRLYPEYGFIRHKGYATAEHRKALLQFGQSPVHRKTFRVNHNCRDI